MAQLLLSGQSDLCFGERSVGRVALLAPAFERGRQLIDSGLPFLLGGLESVGSRGQNLSLLRALSLLCFQAVNLIDDRFDFLGEHARRILQRLEFTLARG